MQLLSPRGQVDRSMSKQQIHFLTGRLAENALAEILGKLSVEVGFGYTIQCMPITVAALMSVDWIGRKIDVPNGTDRVILPGYCKGDLSQLQNQIGIPVELGPKDLRKLPEHFGKEATKPDLSNYSIEIIAEINHAPSMPISQVVELAKQQSAAGANFIDIGCIPGQTCRSIGDYVKAVADIGVKVSIDSLNVNEISAATSAGAELVLSVNASNRNAAADWGCEVVVIPDEISNIDSMHDTIELLASKNVPLRIDPILEPIGLGFANSLNRYHQSRSRWPDAEMMMGIGNITELTDVDSAGINFVLLGICEELNIRSVLTTQVINWARSSVKECDIARRLVHFATQQGIPPKNLSVELVCMRDARLLNYSDEQLEQLAANIKDHNYRLFHSQNKLHLLGSGKKFSDTDPFNLFDQLSATQPKNLDASHSFYLGYELCKAMIAMQLGKNYVQDEALDWGHLTVDESNRHRLSKRFRKEDSKEQE